MTSRRFSPPPLLRRWRHRGLGPLSLLLPLLLLPSHSLAYCDIEHFPFFRFDFFVDGPFVNRTCTGALFPTSSQFAAGGVCDFTSDVANANYPICGDDLYPGLVALKYVCGEDDLWHFHPSLETGASVTPGGRSLYCPQYGSCTFAPDASAQGGFSLRCASDSEDSATCPSSLPTRPRFISLMIDPRTTKMQLSNVRCGAKTLARSLRSSRSLRSLPETKAYVRRLERLAIVASQLTRVEDTAFDGMDALVSLDLSANALSATGALMGLPHKGQLQELDLSLNPGPFLTSIVAPAMMTCGSPGSLFFAVPGCSFDFEVGTPPNFAMPCLRYSCGNDSIASIECPRSPNMTIPVVGDAKACKAAGSLLRMQPRAAFPPMVHRLASSFFLSRPAPPSLPSGALLRRHSRLSK